MFPVICIFGIDLAVFPILLLIAICICAIYCINSKKYCIEYYRDLMKIMFYPIVCAFLCGRTLYALTLKPSSVALFLKYVIDGGFVFYGGLFGAVVGLIIFCKIEKYNVFDYTDVFLSILPLGQAIGRIGCYFNGCCYGRIYDGPFSIEYSVNNDTLNVFPTWFIESIFLLSLFLYFQFLGKCLYRGYWTGVYLIVYSVFRFVLEFFRGDSIRGFWLCLSTSQWISLVVFMSGIFVFLYTKRKKNKNTLIKEIIL